MCSANVHNQKNHRKTKYTTREIKSSSSLTTSQTSPTTAERGFFPGRWSCWPSRSATSRSSQTLCVGGVGCGVVSRALQVLSQVFLSGAEGAPCFLSGARHSTADLSNYHTPGPWRRGGSAHSLPTLQPILRVSHTRTRAHTRTHTYTDKKSLD